MLSVVILGYFHILSIYQAGSRNERNVISCLLVKHVQIITKLSHIQHKSVKKYLIYSHLPLSFVQSCHMPNITLCSSTTS